MNRLSILLLFLGGFLWGSPDTVSIRDIQYPGGPSPYAGQEVVTWGVVTAAPSDWARSIHGFFIQDSSGPWQGVLVYTEIQNLDVQRGDSVLVIGTVSEYYEKTEIQYTSHVLLKRGAMIPLPVHVNTGDLATGSEQAEQYEGVLVIVNDVTVTNPNLGYGEWAIDDGSGDCRVDDAAGYTYTPSPNDHIPGLIGIVDYSYSNFKIEPRGDEDFFFTLQGSGLSWSTTPLVPASSPIDSIAIYFYGVLTDTVRVVKFVVPPDFSWTGSESDVVLGGIFEGVSFEIEGDGSPSSPYTVTVEHPAVLGDMGWVTFKNLTSPSEGDYVFYVLSGTPSSLDTLKHQARVSVLTVDGSGEVSLHPDEYPVGVSSDLGLTLRSNLGMLTVLEIAIPESTLSWSGESGDLILGEGFEGATVDSVAPDYVRISGFQLQANQEASLTLFGVQAVGSPGACSLTVRTAGEGGSPDDIASPPYFFILREDSTYPLRLFHEIPDLLSGRSGTRVRGVVTADLDPKVFIQDSTGGIVLFAPDGLYSIGDMIWVKGTFSPYRGLAELQDPVVERREPSVIDTLTITGSILHSDTAEFLEGKFVMIRNVWTSATTLPYEDTLRVSDSTAFFVVYIDPSSNLGYRTIPEGTFDLFGVIDQRDSLYRVVPRGPYDLRFKGNGSGIAYTLPPYIFIEDTSGRYSDPIEEIKIVLRSWADTIKTFSLTLPEELGDSTKLMLSGDLTGAIGPDTVIGNTYYFYSVKLLEDTITLSDFLRPEEPCSLVFEIKTSLDSAGVMQAIFEQPTVYVVYPIAMVQAPGPDGFNSAMTGKSVRIAGVVTGPSEVFSPEGKTSFWIQDRSGGVNIFYNSLVGPFNIGQLVLVMGTVTEYNGTTEITPSSPGNLQVLFEQYEVPAPETLRVSEALREDLEGLYVYVKEAEVAAPPSQAGTGKNFYIWNGQAPIAVYVYPETGIDLSSIQVGDIVNVQGIVGQYDQEEPYNSGYQLLPRIPGDIEIVTTPPREAVELSISPNVFAPDIGEVLRIEVQGPATTRFTLKVLDTEGREIARLADSRSGSFTYLWKGLDKNGNKVPIGLYILQLKALRNDGQEETINKVFVISTPFK